MNRKRNFKDSDVCEEIRAYMNDYQEMAIMVNDILYSMSQDKEFNQMPENDRKRWTTVVSLLMLIPNA